MANEIRVRFAPSPTGFLHVGGLRTALYDYLYAKKTGGKFVLRIEDTDQNRLVEGAAESLIEILQNIGLEFDEGPGKEGDCGPYFQSQRLDIYNKHINELLEKDYAYHCFCTADELDKMRDEQKARGEDARYDGRCKSLTKEDVQAKIAAGMPYVIRLKTPDEGEITYYDVVRDKVTFDWSTVDDQVLLKSDGFPTYHLAVTVDDHLMGITHIFRGEEWISSVPKHLLLFQAFGWKPPKMAHLPLLLNSDRSKLSKRQGDVAVEDYLKKGYLPEALINFVALLGWHPASDKEFFSLKELEKDFSLKRINKAGAVFDVEKLKWMNAHYIKTSDAKYIAEKAKPFFTELDISDEGKYLKVIKEMKERAVLLSDLPEIAKMFYNNVELKDDDLEIVTSVSGKQLLKFWADEISESEYINANLVNELLKRSASELGIKGKNLYHPLRLALIGTVNGPEIPMILNILGKEESVRRLRN
jgi:nondiscriminating glutamyl-tRNA synthetase